MHWDPNVAGKPIGMAVKQTEIASFDDRGMVVVAVLFNVRSVSDVSECGATRATVNSLIGSLS